MGWWGKSKNKNRAGETEKKYCAPQGLSEVHCKGGTQIWKIKKKFFDISNSVRKNFLNLNVADICAKKAFVRENVF